MQPKLKSWSLCANLRYPNIPFADMQSFYVLYVLFSKAVMTELSIIDTQFADCSILPYYNDFRVKNKNVTSR